MTNVGVYLEDQLVGQLGEGRDGRFEFRFTDAYRRLVSRPVLGQRFEDDLGRVYVGKRPGSLPAFFANLLPEGNLRTVIEHSLGLEEPTDLDLLAAAEADLPGAIRLRPTHDDLALSPGRRSFEDEPVLDKSGSRFRFSLAGAQLKFSAIHVDDRFTIPARDHAGEWIIKVGSERFNGLVANEYSMLSWARNAGFAVPDIQLVDAEQMGELADYGPEGERGLAIRRYDRHEGRRVHQEDFNQVLGIHPKADGTEKYELSYDQLLAVIAAVTGNAGFLEAIERLAFAVACGNSDAHLKNWSLVYPDGIHPELSPLYDQVCVIAWPGLDRELALKLMGSRHYGEVSLDTFGRLASKLAVGVEPDEATEAVTQVFHRLQATWKDLDRSLMASHHVDALRDHWQRVPLLRGFGPL